MLKDISFLGRNSIARNRQFYNLVKRVGVYYFAVLHNAAGDIHSDWYTMISPTSSTTGMIAHTGTAATIYVCTHLAINAISMSSTGCSVYISLDTRVNRTSISPASSSHFLFLSLSGRSRSRLLEFVFAWFQSIFLIFVWSRRDRQALDKLSTCSYQFVLWWFKDKITVFKIT